MSKKFFLSKLAGAVFVLFLAGCGDDNNGSSQIISLVAINSELAEIRVPVGKTQKVAVKVVPKEASYLDFVWTSADTTIVTVTKGTVTGIVEGSTTITVTSGTVSNSEVTTEIPVTVLPLTAEPLTSFEVAEKSVDMALDGEPVQLTVTKEPETSTLNVTYTTLAEGIVTVSKMGLITPVALGSDTIIVSAEGLPSVKIPVDVARQVFSLAGNPWTENTSTLIEYSGDVGTITVIGEGNDPQFYLPALPAIQLASANGKVIFECITNRATNEGEAHIYWFKGNALAKITGLYWEVENVLPAIASFSVPLCEDWTIIKVDIPAVVFERGFGQREGMRDAIRIDPVAGGAPDAVGYQIKYRNMRIVIY
jgi:hypothetical protein